MLDWLRSRRSVRTFTTEPVPRDVMERVLEGAITAPSSTNRQPWRFAVVRAAAMRKNIVDAVGARTAEIKRIISRSHHAEDFGNYGDFFVEPLASAQVIVVPQYREYPDLIANLIASGGGDPRGFLARSGKEARAGAAGTGIMAALLEGHGGGVGGWMMGGAVGRGRDIYPPAGNEEPLGNVGAIAIGYPTPGDAP